MASKLALDTDSELMSKVGQGDKSSFDILLERHRALVVNHLYRLVRNRPIAEELAQDVFLRVYRSRKTYQPQAKFTTWLFRITTNIALNWRRDTRREAAYMRLDEDNPSSRKIELPDPMLRADERLVLNHRAQEIRAAIEKLSPKQQAAVLMHKYQGMDYAEIAQALDCSIPALKSLLFRAYQTLRQRLAHFAPARVA